MMDPLRLLYLALVVSWTAASDMELEGEEVDTDVTGYKEFLTDLIRTAKRDVVTDHGYGSRLKAGTEVANAITALDNIYGVYGPGKRSLSGEDYILSTNDDGDLVGQLPKRYYTDLGYGSRVTAGKNIADDKWVENGLFGSSGPGKRSSEDRRLISFLRKMRNGQIGDAGFMSRIGAAKLLARDTDAGYNIFGHMGPGKRR